MHYYNEIDKTAVAWLRNLIGVGLLPEGDVDERSIRDVQASDLKGYTQCHFFAGIGGWPLALALAGWPTTRPVWPGSCPCQPFSNAGRQTGTDDPRHLWPEFQRLIAECQPATVFGEQVASKAGRSWLSGVRTDLEALAYGVGASDLCAASVGAPHIRQRLYWVAHSISEPVRAEPRGVGGTATTEPSQGVQRQRTGSYAGHSSTPSGVAHSYGVASPSHARDYGEVRSVSEAQCQPEHSASISGRGSTPSGVGHAQCSGLMDTTLRNGEHDAGGRSEWDAPLNQREPSQGRGDVSPWADSISIPFLDGKWRRTQPGVKPLAHGVPGRVGKLRAYGNAIVPQVAAEFITAYMEVMPIS